MSRLTACGILGVVALVIATPAAGALEVRLTVTPREPRALERATVVLDTFLPLVRADGSCCRLSLGGPRSYPFRVEAVSPTGKIVAVPVRRSRAHRWHGTVRFPTSGRWQLRVTNYAPSYRHSSGARPRMTIRVLPARPTPPPAGFGPLGQPGCEPASPLDASSRGTPDVYGSAFAGEQLWALPFVPEGADFVRRDAAEFEGLVGKEIKIVFGMTAFHAPFRAVGPNGGMLAPKWGPSFHSGSSWDRRPGVEWGAGFVFPSPGCWRIAVGSAGSLYFLVRS